MEEEEQVQIVYPIVPRPLPPRDKKVRPSKTPHVTVAMAMAVAVGAAGFRRLSERDYFGTRATWLSEKGYCDASGHAVAVSETTIKKTRDNIFFLLTSREINRQVRDVKLVGFTMTL